MVLKDTSCAGFQHITASTKILAPLSIKNLIVSGTFMASQVVRVCSDAKIYVIKLNTFSNGDNNLGIDAESAVSVGSFSQCTGLSSK